MKARPPRTGGLALAENEQSRALADERAAQARADTMHPLVASFVRVQTAARLRALPLDDPEWGHRRREELKQEWDAHVERGDERQLAVGTGGPRRGGGLLALDPLAALGRPAQELMKPMEDC